MQVGKGPLILNQMNYKEYSTPLNGFEYDLSPFLQRTICKRVLVGKLACRLLLSIAS